MATMKNITMESSLMKSLPKKFTDRPMERVRFATPQAELTYNRIRRLLRENAEKLRRYQSFGMLSESADKSKNEKSTKTSNKRPFCSRDSAKPETKKRKIVGQKQNEDPFIASLGPIPSDNSTIFSKMCFVLCHASQDEIVDHESSKDDEVFFSEARLTVQINAGGGKVYSSFELVPKEELEDTRLITNASSSHPEMVHCTEAGIPAYSHRWIIKCCQKNKTVDPSDYKISSPKQVTRSSMNDAAA